LKGKCEESKICEARKGEKISNMEKLRVEESDKGWKDKYIKRCGKHEYKTMVEHT